MKALTEPPRLPVIVTKQRNILYFKDLSSTHSRDVYQTAEIDDFPLYSFQCHPLETRLQLFPIEFESARKIDPGLSFP